MGTLQANPNVNVIFSGKTRRLLEPSPPPAAAHNRDVAYSTGPQQREPPGIVPRQRSQFMQQLEQKRCLVVLDSYPKT